MCVTSYKKKKIIERQRYRRFGDFKISAFHQVATFDQTAEEAPPQGNGKRVCSMMSSWSDAAEMPPSALRGKKRHSRQNINA